MVLCDCCKETSVCRLCNRRIRPIKNMENCCKADLYEEMGLEVPPGTNPKCPAYLLKHLAGSGGLSDGKICKAAYLNALGFPCPPCCSSCSRSKSQCNEESNYQKRRSLRVALIEKVEAEVAVIQKKIDLLQKEREYFDCIEELKNPEFSFAFQESTESDSSDESKCCCSCCRRVPLYSRN